MRGIARKSTDGACRVIAVSLSRAEGNLADRLTDIIRQGGNPLANRSFVMREALRRLAETWDGMTPEEIVADIAAYHARRVRAGAPSPRDTDEMG
jgi:hypothetical protein